MYSLLDDSDEESDKDASLKCKHADVGSSSSSSLSLPDEDQEAQKTPVISLLDDSMSSDVSMECEQRPSRRLNEREARARSRLT